VCSRAMVDAGSFQRAHLEPAASRNERLYRHYVDLCIRHAFATVFGLALMDFMYSSLWLHGYVYALNMNYTAVGHHNDSHLPDFQFTIFPAGTRALAAAAIVLAVHAFLRCHMNALEPLSIWQLWKRSWAIGVLCAAMRCLQHRHRVLPIVHDAFFAYLAFFFASLFLLTRSSKVNEKVKMK